MSFDPGFATSFAILATTESRAGGEQAEVLLKATAPTRQAGGEQVEVIVVPANTLRVRQVGGLQVEVLITPRHYVVTPGAPSVPVQLKWDDGTWHQLLAIT